MSGDFYCLIDLSPAPGDNFHKNSVPGRVLILLKRRDAFALRTVENCVNVCVSLFALAARKLRDQFIAKLPSWWLFRLEYLSLSPMLASVWTVLFLVPKVNSGFFLSL